MLRLHPSTIDYAILAIYFVVVLGIGFVARLAIKTDLDFFLSGRSLPAWITGLAFIAANLGALEILGQAANGAQYGVAAVHYYWLGAVPAMVFLGLVMMPFYYGAKVRSVPEYLRLRFNEATHAFNAGTFAVATVLISGVNLFALALIIHLMLGWSIAVAILVAAAMVLVYITLGRTDVGDLQRGAAVLRHRRGAAAADARGAARGGRHQRPHGQGQALQAAGRSGAARVARPGDPPRDQPDRPPTGLAWCSAWGSCSASATGRPTSPRSSARCRLATCPPRGGRR